MAYIDRLKTFFMQNDPDRMYLAKKIYRSFRHDEDAVMKRLEEIYSSGGPKKLVVKELPKSKTKPSSTSIESKVTEKETTSNENLKPPKKGKLKKIIIISSSIILLGIGGFFGYTIFFSGVDHEEVHSENHNNDTDDKVSESDADQSHGVEHNEASHEDISHEGNAVTDSIIDNIESKIDSAKKDSTVQDLKDAADAIKVIGL